MKCFIIVLLFQFFAITSFCQKTEFNFTVYSGLFSYRGSGAASSSTMNYGIYTPIPYTTTVYGRHPGFSVSFEAEAIRNTPSNFLYGLGLSYDLLNSKVTINKAQFSPEIVVINESYLYDATGNTSLKNVYVNINPCIGKRFLKNKIILDVLGGFDLGRCLKSVEEGHATINSSQAEIHSNISQPYPSIDFRPRVQFKAGYKRTGIIIGYSLGLTNYQSVTTSKAYTSFLRLGLCYRVR